MQRVIALFLAVIVLTTASGCGDTKVIGGVEYDTYGFFNEDDTKNTDIAYEPIWGNIVWGVILIETIVAPIYFFGYSLFEPVGRKPAIKGQVPK